MKNVSRFLVFCAGLLALWNSFLQEAQAVPSYTRRYGVECARCHSVWGGLTGAGNTFKLSGYRAINGVPLKPESEDIELAHGTLTIPTTLPLSFITGVGYDWRSEKREPAGAPSRDATGSTLALEDASIFLTSPIGNHLAAFVEFPMYESRAWEFTPTGEADVHAKVPSNLGSRSPSSSGTTWRAMPCLAIPSTYCSASPICRSPIRPGRCGSR
jgi:hypothetical protein